MAEPITHAPLDASVERWFLRRGTPHLIAGYSATEDVFTRAAPWLVLIFLVSVFGAGNVSWSWWQNALAVLAGLSALLGLWAMTNRLRGRPTWALPDTVGAWELVLFVAGPTALQAVGGQWRAAAVTAGSLATVLGVLYVGTSYGVVPMTRWALTETVTGVQAVVGLLLRALPLLLLVVTFLFINAELWDVAGNAPAPFFAVTVGLFIAVGLLFVVARLPVEFERLRTFDDAAELRSILQGTPLAGASDASIATAVGREAALSTRQRRNVLLVALFSQGLQVVLVAVMIGLFFCVLGLFAISSTTLEHWVGHPGDVLFETRVWGNDLVLHAELLRTAGFLSAFSALHFAVTLVTDETYRREFFELLLQELRQTLAVHAVYSQPAGRGGSATEG